MPSSLWSLAESFFSAVPTNDEQPVWQQPNDEQPLWQQPLPHFRGHSFFVDYDTKAKVPLCDDLNDVVLRNGEDCFSECGESMATQRCPKRVIEPGLSFVKQPLCKSHTECVGRADRVLCHAVKGGTHSAVLDTKLA